MFDLIFKLSSINPRLANELFQKSKARFSPLFRGQDFNNLIGTLLREADSPFKQWFLSQAGVVLDHPAPVVAPAVTAAPPIAPSAAARPPIAPIAAAAPLTTPSPAAGVGTTIAATTPPAATKQERYKTAITPLLKTIEEKIALLKRKGDHAAAGAFTTMVQEIQAAQTVFERSSPANTQAETTFIQQCSFAINHALPILENRGAQRVFVPIVEAVLSLATLLRIITPEVKKQTLFQMKTNSAQRALELKEALLNIHGPSEEDNPTAGQRLS